MAGTDYIHLEQIADLEEFDLLASQEQTRADKARSVFGVDGAGVSVAVIDTGCAPKNPGLRAAQFGKWRVAHGRDFTGLHKSGVGSEGAADDIDGHGTAVAGIIASRLQNLPGVAPKATIVPLKVTNDRQSFEFEALANALEWLVGNAKNKGISIVNVSLGDTISHRTSADAVAVDAGVRQRIADSLASLRNADIPVVAASGNAYKANDSSQGLSFPSIVPETISVGAVFTKDAEFSDACPSVAGAFSNTPVRDAIAPFTQRLARQGGQEHFLDMVAPGAPMKSLSHMPSVGFARACGTSLAAPVAAGVIALLQHKFQKIKGAGELPTCTQVEKWLESGAKDIEDKDLGHDNVQHTGKTFRRIDAFGALQALVANPN